MLFKDFYKKKNTSSIPQEHNDIHNIVPSYKHYGLTNKNHNFSQTNENNKESFKPVENKLKDNGFVHHSSVKNNDGSFTHNYVRKTNNGFHNVSMNINNSGKVNSIKSSI
jgi:ketol-acid reductoisomerase